jgi:hypothetical protein
MANTVVVTAIAENRADGAWWVTGTVDAAPWAYRWTKPLDVSPGSTAVSQGLLNEYNAVNTALTGKFLGKTVNVVFVGTPTPSTFAVAFSATLASAFVLSAPNQMVLMGTVNASATAYHCQITVQEFLEWNNAGLNIAQIIATRIVQNYMSSVGGFLASYLSSQSLTPQMFNPDTGALLTDAEAEAAMEAEKKAAEEVEKREKAEHEKAAHEKTATEHHEHEKANHEKKADNEKTHQPTGRTTR